MKITNNHGLHETIVRMVSYNNHTVSGDISVTQMIGPVQERYLKFKHKDELEVDAHELILAAMGTSMHLLLEMADHKTYRAKVLAEALEEISKFNDSDAQDIAVLLEHFLTKGIIKQETNPDVLREFRLKLNVNGVMLSGTLDRFYLPEGLLEDYKNVGVYQYLQPEAKADWVTQQNTYAYMLKKMGYEVDKAQIVAMFRDWTNVGILKNRDYPKSRSEVIPITLYSDEQILSYIEKRIVLHDRAIKYDEVPECTTKERWNIPDVYAVKKKGGKRALKKLFTEEAAEKYIEEEQFKFKPGELYIEQRAGEDKKCDKYCPVAKFCGQYAKIKETRESFKPKYK